jgi:hypothetical protein
MSCYDLRRVLLLCPSARSRYRDRKVVSVPKIHAFSVFLLAGNSRTGSWEVGFFPTPSRHPLSVPVCPIASMYSRKRSRSGGQGLLGNCAGSRRVEGLVRSRNFSRLYREKRLSSFIQSCYSSLTSHFESLAAFGSGKSAKAVAWRGESGGRLHFLDLAAGESVDAFLPSHFRIVDLLIVRPDMVRS